MSLLRFAAALAFALAAIGLFVDWLDVTDGLALVALGLVALVLSGEPWKTVR